MDAVMNYVKPELLVLVPVLYILGEGLKKARLLRDEYIPLALGGMGFFLVVLWLLGNEGAALTLAGWAMLLFTGLVQGLLVAGMAVYSNQLLKQSKKLRAEG